MGISIIREPPISERGFSRRHTVEVVFVEPRAKSVYFLCSVDGFSRRTHPMDKQGEIWRIVLRLLAGEYEYAFLIDGFRIVTDPENPDVRKRSDGSEVSVMRFGVPDEARARRDGSIDLASVYHDQLLPFLEAFRDQAIYRLRVAKEDIEQAYLLSKDGRQVPMEWISFDDHFDYYECRLPVAFSLDYAFKVVDADAEAFLGSEGPAESLSGCKAFPFPPRQIPKFDCPEWGLGCAYYQLLPDRFRDGDPLNNPKGALVWSGAPTAHGYFGGDLAGLFQAVTYLRDLGVSAVRVMPVFLSPSNDNFDVFDYYHVDVHLGTDEMFAEVVEALHKEGIRTVLDVVFNHTGLGFFAFRDIVRNQESSQYANWYTVHEFPVSRRRPITERIVKRLTGAPDRTAYEAHMDRPEWPELNFRSLEVRSFVREIVSHWIKKARIDGVWLSVAEGIPHYFAAEIRRAAKRANPDAVVIGDVKTDPVWWLHTNELDSATDLSFRTAVCDYFLRGKTPPSEFIGQLLRSKGLMPWGAVLAKCNQIDDEFSERAITAGGGDSSKAALAMIFQLTYPGSPVILYGDEVGLAGDRYPSCRGSMIWDPDMRDEGMLELYRRLLKARRDSEALRLGWIKFLAVDDQLDLVVFQRWTESDLAITVIRRTGDPQPVALPIPAGTYRDLISWETFTSSEGSLHVELRGGSSLVLIRERPTYAGMPGPGELSRVRA